MSGLSEAGDALQGPPSRRRRMREAMHERFRLYGLFGVDGEYEDTEEGRLRRRVELMLARLFVTPAHAHEFVLKYMSSEFSAHFPAALRLWEHAAELIEMREEALDDYFDEEDRQKKFPHQVSPYDTAQIALQVSLWLLSIYLIYLFVCLFILIVYFICVFCLFILFIYLLIYLFIY